METRKPTLDELKHYYYNDRKRFDEIAKYYYEKDRTYYQETISQFFVSPPPIDSIYSFNKSTIQNKESSKTPLIIIAILILLIGLLAALFMFYNKPDNTENKNETVKANTTFEKAMVEYEYGDFEKALGLFKLVTQDDSDYQKSQEYISLCNEKIEKRKQQFIEEEKKDNKYKEETKKLQTKYNKIFGGNGWLHEKQSKLANLNFSEYKSGYEKAPDGSQQIKTYYKKKEGNYYVHVSLQFSYSLEHHYANVWVE